MAREPSFTPRAVLRCDGDERSRAEDLVVVEEPLEIRIGDEPLAVTMRTPGDDLELAAGFCWTEGIVADPDELESVEACAEAEHENVVRVTLGKAAVLARRDAIERSRRELYLTSSCGLCGVQSIDRVERNVRPPDGRFRVSAGVLAALPVRMQEGQGAFAATGGLHAAALFTVDGALVVLREDVGRHNAVDKVIGHQLLLGTLPFDPGILLVSGRASFEVIQKAAAGGIALVCAVSAPSSLAIDLARRLDLTLVGFLRPGRMNVYHDRGRIAGL